MADLSTPIPQIAPGQGQKEVTANALFDAASSAMIFGRNAAPCVGLVFGYLGGRMNGTAVANGTVTATASSINYVVAHRTTLAVSISTSDTNWNNTATYGRCFLLDVGASAIDDHEDHRLGTGGIFDGGAGAAFTGGTLTSPLNYAPTDTIASATTTDIGAADSNYISITGTTTITGLGTIAAGALRFVTFAGALLLTHNATSLILPGGANITTAAGDSAAFVSLGSGNWRCLVYTKANGYAVRIPFRFMIAFSDETTDLTTGTAKLTFRWPFPNSTLVAVEAELNTASSSGNPAFDVNEAGASIFSTTLTIDSGETTSATAATPAVISDAAIAHRAVVTVDIDTAGTGAKGGKLTFIGYYFE
ncbi:MAG: hypothetical protein WC809_18810 [Sinimarinibacterium sp.]|jgi:hypothetical protein